MRSPKTIEDIYESIGGFGRFQFLVVCIILFPELPCASIDFQPIFTGAHPTKWICTNNAGSIDVTNDTEAQCACNGTLDGGHGSIVAEWGLICDKAWVTDFVTSIQMAGFFAGDILATVFADKFGRKKTFYTATFSALFGSIASSVARSPVEYAVARFFCGMGISAVVIIGSIYPMEFLTPKWRTLTGGVGPWGEGIMTLSLCAYYFRQWRQLCIVTALPLFLVFFTSPFLPESPRWLLAQGRSVEARNVFKKIARWNKKSGRTRSPDEEEENRCLLNKLDFLQDNLTLSCAENNNNNNNVVTLKQFLADAKSVKKTLIFMSLWFTCALLFYGIGFNTKNLSGDPYWNVFYLALVDLIGFRSAIFISRWLGRRRAIMLYMGSAAFFMLNIIVMRTEFSFFGLFPPQTEAGSDWLFNVFTFAGKMFAAACLAVVDCFTSESYPTASRSTGVGFANFAASVGGILAPQMAYFGSVYKTGPYFVFAFFAACSTASTLLLKETNGKPLEEHF